MMPNRRRRRLAAGLGVVAAAALAWWLLGRPPSAAPGIAAPDPTPANPAAKAAPSVAAPRRTTAPGPDEALPPIFEGLRQRALAGDARAGCQLATKLLFCASVAPLIRPELRRKAREWEEASAARGDLEQANRNAEMQLASIRAANACPEVPEDAARLGYEWMRHAALAGDPDAMLLHASGATLVTGLQDGWSFLRDGRFHQWRQEAHGMLQALLERRDPAALLALLDGHTGSGYLNWITPPEPVRARELSLLAREVFGRPGEFMPSDFPWGDRQAYRRAREDGRRLHQQYFEGATFELQRHKARLRSPSGLMQQEFVLPTSCDTAWSEP